VSRFESTQKFRDYVLSSAGSLPPQQRAIADYLVNHLDEVPFLAVPELAELIEVSEATIVRFAQSLGFRGYRDLKVELLQLPNATSPGVKAEPSAPYGQRNMLRSVARLEMDNIRATIDLISVQTLEHVADLIHHAEHTYVFGMGVSAPLAVMARYILIEVGVRCSVLSTDFTSPEEQLFALRSGDLLIGFSLPNYSRQTLGLLKGAKERGATTVTITDSLASPAAAIAAWTLPVRTHNMMFTNAVAAVIVVLNAIATQYAVRHRSRSLEALAHMSRSMSSPDVVEAESGESAEEP
jgi:DNA-binding MurR/RpiR family transcriptional regulator